MTRPVLRIKDDGTLLMRGRNILIPLHWIATDVPGIYKCLLPACKYRRFSYHTSGGKLNVQFHCFLKQINCTSGECNVCAEATPDQSILGKVTVEDTIVTWWVEPTPDLKLINREKAHWKLQPMADGDEPVRTLTNIEATLPPHKEGRDRKVTFEGDAISYEPVGDEPLDINGYQRDPDNPFRFTSLWPACQLRHSVGVRYAKCGCINVIMRCNNPVCPKFADRVKHEQCQACENRQ